MSFMKSACRFDQLGKENTYIGDSTSSRILPIPKAFIKLGRELQALNCPTALSTRVSKCPSSARVPQALQRPSAKSLEWPSALVPFECPSAQMPFEYPWSDLGVSFG